MKRVAIIFIVLTTLDIQAKCMSDQLTISPLQQTISTNTCLLVEGYGISQSFVESLTFDISVALVSDHGEQIKLNAIEYNQGDFRINQSILRPEQALKLGSNYTLKFENLDKLERLPHALNDDKQPHTWMVIDQHTNQPASLLTQPRLIESRTQFFGCGPAISAEFEFITDSKTPVLVKTQLKDITNNETKTYFLKTSVHDTLKVGHGMCSGAFRYIPEHNYQVRFSIMDACNSLADDWTDWISFKNPTGGSK